jgi:hypothetical protein
MDETTKGERHETPHWTDGLDDRTRTHIAYARVYASDYAHGAPGHLDLMTIAVLAGKLDAMEPARFRTTNLLTPADAKPFDTGRAPDTSKRPKGFT